MNQVTTKFTEGSFQLTLALGKLSFFVDFDYDLATQKQKQYKRSTSLHAIAMQNHELKISAIFQVKIHQLKLRPALVNVGISFMRMLTYTPVWNKANKKKFLSWIFS